ncbi:MAG: hypothetical protein U9R21_07815, partial [Candidatus Thermoplasmatota archaeon]|nr:hypothetical protein [Candidatus Thermoplasmatota archaeon]
MSKIKIIIFIILVCSINKIYAQNQYTPYDDIPGVIKSYKPAYQDNFADWAKMLYQYPVNFFEITQEFETYNSQHQGEKSPEIRYFKIWHRAISPYVLNDGTIKLPDIDSYYKNLYKSQINASKKLSFNNKSNSNWTFLGPK